MTRRNFFAMLSASALTCWLKPNRSLPHYRDMLPVLLFVTDMRESLNPFDFEALKSKMIMVQAKRLELLKSNLVPMTPGKDFDKDVARQCFLITKDGPERYWFGVNDR